LFVNLFIVLVLARAWVEQMTEQQAYRAGMAVRNLEDIANLKRVRDELQLRLDLFEAGGLDIALNSRQAEAAARRLRRAIAEYDALIRKSRPLKMHRDESIHLF
jgi:hypothetical protein